MGITASLIKLGTSAAGKSAFKKGFELLMEKAGEHGVDFFTSWKGKKTQKIENIYKYFARVRMVKTLWQVDHAVDISAFYCDCHIYVGPKRILIGSLNDFPDGNVLVEGIAGQGKSIFLRYLTAVELVSGGPIPLYIELRRVVDSPSLDDCILAALKEYGLGIDTASFHKLADSGRIILLLDALDEVSEDSKPRVINEIEHLAKRHPEMRIIVSARLNSGLKASPHFQVVRLSDLEGNEYKAVIGKLMEEPKSANQLLKRIGEHHGRVTELLKTPLLVTLLVINYKSFQEIPEQLSDFYGQLFNVLLQRHDGTKPGYKRQRSCKLNDSQCRKAFEALCFFVKQQKGILNHTSIVQIAEKALADIGSTEDPEKYLHDIVSVTCLLVKDGEEYRFIHKSVQEYYCASWIQFRPEVLAQKIYRKMFNSGGWIMEIYFLKEIDTYRFYKFGLIPAILAFLKLDQEDLKTQNLPKAVSAIREKLSDTNARVYLNSDGSSAGISFPHIPTCASECLGPFFHGIDYKPSLEAIRAIQTPKSVEDPEPFWDLQLSFATAQKEDLLNKEIQEAATKSAKQLLNLGAVGLAFIEKAEADAALSNLLE